MTGHKTVLYYLPIGEGGLTHYAAFQVQALARLGMEIVVLGYPVLKEQLAAIGESPTFIELPPTKASTSRIVRAIRWIWATVMDAMTLRRAILEHDGRYVLFGSYSEYWAPFWIWPLRGLSQIIPFGVVVHDPSRDFILGPKWWHQLSIAMSYSIFREAYVHSVDTTLDASHLDPVFVPQGTYRYPPCTESRDSTRSRIGIPGESYVLLSFGHIRDGKNLGLLISALTQLSGVHLLVVGREQSSHDKTVAEYRRMATERGVQDRTHFVNRFVADDEVSNYFNASDGLALTYSADFRSASAVLNSNVQFELPVIASGGAGPLSSAIERYRLGVWIAPGEVSAIVEGVNLLQLTPPAARWGEFESDHSWKKNAEIVAEKMG